MRRASLKPEDVGLPTRRTPPHARPAPRGGRAARRRRRHLVHVARAGPRRAGIARCARGSLTSAAADTGRAHPLDSARPRRRGAAVQAPGGARLPHDPAPDREPRDGACIRARSPLGLPRLEPRRMCAVRRLRQDPARGAQPSVADVHGSRPARDVRRLGARSADGRGEVPRRQRESHRRLRPSTN